MATHFCKTCRDSEPLCKKCADQHIRQRSCRDHQISDVIEKFQEKMESLEWVLLILCLFNMRIAKNSTFTCLSI